MSGVILNLLETYQSNPSFVLLLSFTALALTFTLFLLNRSQTKNATSPPSPPTLPILGNFHQLGIHPHRSLKTLSQTYGPIMLLHLGNVPVLVISSADFAREIMKSHDLIFSNRPKSKAVEKLLYNYKDLAFAPYGEYWRQMKSISVLHLLSAKRVQSFRKVREEETTILIEKIKELCDFGLHVNLSEALATLTNDVVCRVALGKKYSVRPEGRKFKELLNELMELLGGFDVGDYIPWLSWMSRVNGLDGKLERVAKETDELLEEVLEEHMNRLSGGGGGGQGQADGEDFVDVLLGLQREDSTAGFLIDRSSIKAVVLDTFAAGTDTTYTLMEWTMTELLRHPQVMKKFQDEVRNISKGKQQITENDLENLKYVKAVIKETLRLHPPAPLLVPRKSSQDIDIKGFHVSAGTQVVINAWVIGTDPETWIRPEEFWPERFLESPVDFKGHDFELIPFGAGRRGCPGVQFAAIINELVLANLALNFDWSVPGDNLDTSESTGITIRKRFPLIVAARIPY